MRAIDAFIDMLDLAALGLEVEADATGRPGYHRALMLMIYVYGYLDQVQSSRRLERECARNLAAEDKHQDRHNQGRMPEEHY